MNGINQTAVAQFTYACRDYLSALSIGDLRAYGRSIGVAKPTEKKKGELVEEIILVLNGKVTPIEQSTRGAPIRNNYLDPQIHQNIQTLRTRYLGEMPAPKEEVLPTDAQPPEFDFQKAYKRFQAENNVRFVVKSNEQEESEARATAAKQIRTGQYAILRGVPCLLALNCIANDETLILPIELIHGYGLCEGDVLACYVQKSNEVLVATEILTINGKPANSLQRGAFEEYEACYPTDRIRFFNAGERNSLVSKYLQWLLPVGKGQRGCILAAPKLGKTEFLYEIAQTAMKFNPELKVLVLLVGQVPEEITRFRKLLPKDALVYTTYEDDPDRQVFTAEFLLKRAKRFAECGREVLLLVDSFNTLSRAYNDTNESIGERTLAGGLERKTVQYLKRFFGAARCLEKSGSLTVIGTLSIRTGNPADDIVAAELCSLANLEICLNEELALKRLYPAVDLLRSRAQYSMHFTNGEEESADRFIRTQYIPKYGAEALFHLIDESHSYEDFINRVTHVAR